MKITNTHIWIIAIIVCVWAVGEYLLFAGLFGNQVANMLALGSFILNGIAILGILVWRVRPWEGN